MAVTLAKSTYRIDVKRNGRVVCQVTGITTPRQAGRALLAERRMLALDSRPGGTAEIVEVPPVVPVG